MIREQRLQEDSFALQPIWEWKRNTLLLSQCDMRLWGTRSGEKNEKQQLKVGFWFI